MTPLSREDLENIQERVDGEHPIASLRLDIDALLQIARRALAVSEELDGTTAGEFYDSVSKLRACFRLEGRVET